jgi:hypothetical protein
MDDWQDMMPRCEELYERPLSQQELDNYKLSIEREGFFAQLEIRKNEQRTEETRCPVYRG